jgi:hypothetical protein
VKDEYSYNIFIFQLFINLPAMFLPLSLEIVKINYVIVVLPFSLRTGANFLYNHDPLPV